MQHTPQSGQNQQNRQQGQSFQKPPFGQQNQQQKGAPFQNQQHRPGQQPPMQKPSPWAAPAQPPKVMMPIAPVSQSSCSSGRMFLLGIIVGMAVVWVWGDMHRNKTGAEGAAIEQNGSDLFAVTGAKGSAAKNVKSTTTASGTSVVGTDAVNAPTGVPSESKIEMADMQPAGMTVAVDGIVTAEPIWAVVYETNEDGTAGRVLGAARFTPEQVSGTIELLRTTLPNLHYFVGLVADSADRTYVYGQNAPLLGADGNQVGASFSAQ